MNTIITNYTDATLYPNRSAFANLAAGEIIAPSYPIFALHKSGEETIVFDERKYSSKNQQRLIDALHTGIITELDKKILGLIGTFSNVSITITAPVKRGQVIAANICGTGVDIVASRSMKKV